MIFCVTKILRLSQPFQLLVRWHPQHARYVHERHRDGSCLLRRDRPLRVQPVHERAAHSGGRYYDVVRQSYAELLQNQERFPNLKLLRGIELGQPLQDLNAAHDALTGRDYDVVIGSLHNIRDHDDFYHIGRA